MTEKLCARFRSPSRRERDLEKQRANNPQNNNLRGISRGYTRSRAAPAAMIRHAPHIVARVLHHGKTVSSSSSGAFQSSDSLRRNKKLPATAAAIRAAAAIKKVAE